MQTYLHFFISSSFQLCVIIIFFMQTRRILEIPIINDFDPEKDEHFEIELYDASGGARIGNINRVAVTIANDDGKL